jgi:hypothetical protein
MVTPLLVQTMVTISINSWIASSTVRQRQPKSAATKLAAVGDQCFYFMGWDWSYVPAETYTSHDFEAINRAEQRRVDWIHIISDPIHVFSEYQKLGVGAGTAIICHKVVLTLLMFAVGGYRTKRKQTKG